VDEEQAVGMVIRYLIRSGSSMGVLYDAYHDGAFWDLGILLAICQAVGLEFHPN
jgi:hypothetical protein